MNTDNSKSSEIVVSTAGISDKQALKLMTILKPELNHVSTSELKEVFEKLGKSSLKISMNASTDGELNFIITKSTSSKEDFLSSMDAIKDLSFVSELTYDSSTVKDINSIMSQSEDVFTKSICCFKVKYKTTGKTTEEIHDALKILEELSPSMVYDTLDAFVNVSLANNQTINELNTVTPRDYEKHFIPVLVGKVGKDSKGYVLIKQSGFYRLIMQNIDEITLVMGRYNLKQNKYMIRLLKNTLEVEKPEHVKFEFEEPDLLSNLIRFKVTNLSGEEIGWKYSAQATSRSKLIQLFNQIVFDKITG